MAKISIIITGIAMSYQKDNRWKVLFPFGNGHDVKFRYSINDTTWSDPVPLAERNRRIEIRPRNSALSTHAVGNYYNDFIDFTGDYAHRDGLQMVNGWEERGILLTIPNANFRLLKFTNTKYVLKEVTSNPDQTVFGPNIIGYSAVAHIETDSQGLDVVQTDPSGTSIIRSFNADTSIWFDNNCMDSTTSDTFMLYYLIKGAGSDSKRFSSERDPEDVSSHYNVLAPLSPELLESSTDPTQPLIDLSNINLFDIARVDETVDPIVAAPPDGVPCHKFRASNSDDLP